MGIYHLRIDLRNGTQIGNRQEEEVGVHAVLRREAHRVEGCWQEVRGPGAGQDARRRVEDPDRQGQGEVQVDGPASPMSQGRSERAWPFAACELHCDSSVLSSRFIVM